MPKTREERRAQINAANERRKARRLELLAAEPDPNADNQPEIALEAAPEPEPSEEKPKKEPIPQLEIWERRLVNPSTGGARVINLKQSGYELRWINLDGVPNRYQEALHQDGWIPVLRSELKDENEVPGIVDRPDGVVRTGPNGVYMLCKMPRHVYEGIAAKKVEISRGLRRGKKSRERTIARAGAVDPRGAEMISRMKGEEQEFRESIDMDEADVDPDLNLPVADR